MSEPLTAASSSPKGVPTRIALTKAQAIIADRMTHSRAVVPDFTLRTRVDMEEVVVVRQRLRAAQKFVPTVNDFVVRAVAVALREHPHANGSYVDGTFELHERVNVGVAVAAPGTLLVPTIFDADRKSVEEVGREMRELTENVRTRTVRPAQLSGGTFTVSNLGMFGIDDFDAVVNEPQAAILAVGRVAPEACVVDGAVAARHIGRLSLSCDHRILYGADAAGFLGRVRDLLEEPSELDELL